MLWVSDEHGLEPKLITLLPEVADDFGWRDIGDIPSRRLEEIEHFFSVYKDLETGRNVTTNGYAGRAKAMALVAESRRRFDQEAASKR